MTTLVYHNGTSNQVSINLRDFNGRAIDLTQATRFVAVLTGTLGATPITLDTGTTSGVITGNSSGNIIFDLSGQTLAEDTYSVDLLMYDPNHTSGQQISDPCCGPYLCIKVCGTPPPHGVYFEAEIQTVRGAPNFVFGVTSLPEGPDPSGNFEVPGFWGIRGRVGNAFTLISNGINLGNSGPIELQLGSIIRIAVNSSGEMWIGLHTSGSTNWFGPRDPSTGTNPLVTGVTGTVRGYSAVVIDPD